MSIITRLCIAGYRSLRDVRLEIGPLTVVTGANGSGKSSLYRALRLLADVAQGRIIQSLALEGGLQSVLWAGPEAFSRAMKAGTQPVQGTVRKNSVSLKLGFSSDDYGFAIDARMASTVTFVRNSTIFFPLAMVFSIGASGTPLMTNLPAFTRSGMRMASVDTVEMMAEM